MGNTYSLYSKQSEIHCISLYSKSCHCICRPLGKLHAEGEHLALAEVVALCKVSLVFGAITIGVALPPSCSTFVVHDPGSGCRQEACLEPSTTLPSKVQRQAIVGAPYYNPPPCICLVFGLYSKLRQIQLYLCVCKTLHECISHVGLLLLLTVRHRCMCRWPRTT